MAKKSKSLSESFVVHASPVTERVVKPRKSNIKLYVLGGLFFLVIIALIVGLYLYEQQKLEEAKEEFREELAKMGKTIETNKTLIDQNRENNLERLANIQELSSEITTMQLTIDEQGEKITAVETEIEDIEIEIDENAAATDGDIIEIMDQLGTIENKVDEQGNEIGSILILSLDSLGNENCLLPGYSLVTLRNLAILYVSAIKHFIYGDSQQYALYDPDSEYGMRMDEEIIPENEERTTEVPMDSGGRWRTERKTLIYNRSEMRKLIAKECYYIGECDDEGPGEYGYYEDRERIEGLRVGWSGDPNISLIMAAAVGTTNNDILNLADPSFSSSYSPINSSYIEDFKIAHDVFHDWYVSDNTQGNPDLKAFLTDIVTNFKTIAYRVFLECILCHMYQSEGRREKGGVKGITNSKTSTWLRDIEPMDFRILHLDMRQVGRNSTIRDFRRYDDDPSVRMTWPEYKESILYSD